MEEGETEYIYWKFTFHIRENLKKKGETVARPLDAPVGSLLFFFFFVPFCWWFSFIHIFFLRVHPAINSTGRILPCQDYRVFLFLVSFFFGLVYRLLSINCLCCKLGSAVTACSFVFVKIGYLGSGCVRVLFCFVFYLFFVFFFGLLLGDRRYGAGGPPSPLPMREPFVFFCKKIKKKQIVKKNQEIFARFSYQSFISFSIFKECGSSEIPVFFVWSLFFDYRVPVRFYWVWIEFLLSFLGSVIGCVVRKNIDHARPDFLFADSAALCVVYWALLDSFGWFTEFQPNSLTFYRVWPSATEFFRF